MDANLGDYCINWDKNWLNEDHILGMGRNLNKGYSESKTDMPVKKKKEHDAYVLG